MDLRQWLKERDSDTYSYVENVRRAVTPLLQRPLHTRYTDHTIGHSDRVIEQLSDLIERALSENNFSLSEAYILLAAAYLHDLGMQDEKSGEGNLEQIREHHSQFSQIRILKYLEQYNSSVFRDQLFPSGLGEIVGLVAEAHRGKVENLKKDDYQTFRHAKEQVRPRLLAALLRFADELDTDFRRAPLEQIKLSVIPPESLFHWYKCYYVESVQIQDEYITIWFRFPRGCGYYFDIFRPIVHGKIKEELEVLQDIFREHGLKLGVRNNCPVREVSGLEIMSPAVEKVAGEERDKVLNRRTPPFPEQQEALALPNSSTLDGYRDVSIQPESNSDSMRGSQALEKAMRVLDILERQAAGYTSLTIPPNLQIELEDKRKQVAQLKADYLKSSRQLSD